MNEILVTVNEEGTYQKLVSFIVLSTSIISNLMAVAFPFLTAKPKILCKNKNIPNAEFESCSLDEFCKSDVFNTILDYENSMNNFTAQFGLFCEKGYYVPLIGSIFFFGAMTGSFLFSSLPDRFGRERIYRIMSFVVCFLQLNMIFVQSPIHLVIINYLNGVFLFCYFMSSIIITEYMSRRNSAILMSVRNAIFSITGISIALFFYTINSWKILFTFTFLTSLSLCVLNTMYITESPRWLYAKNRINDCKDVLRKIAKINGTEENLNKHLQQIQNNGSIFIIYRPTAENRYKQHKWCEEDFKSIPGI
jgi:MFS family permease